MFVENQQIARPVSHDLFGRHPPRDASDALDAPADRLAKRCVSEQDKGKGWPGLGAHRLCVPRRDASTQFRAERHRLVGVWCPSRGGFEAGTLGGVLVSCVMLTTHPKRAGYLPDALRAFRQQTYTPRELVVVNDGEPLVSRAPDVRVVNLPPRSHPWTIGEKRNVGIRAARGELLATWDDDDLSLPWRLDVQARAALQDRLDYVLADSMYIADDQMRVLGDCNRGMTRAVMASAMINRDAAVAAGGYPAVSYLEDFALLEAVRYRARGRVATLQGCNWYVMRRHMANVTLAAGEENQDYIICALAGRRGPDAQAWVDRVRLGAGAEDLSW